MLLVVDANVVFSALIRSGLPLKALRLNSQVNKFEFVAPDLMFEEINGNWNRILSLTSLTEQELNKTLELIKEQIKPVSFSEFAKLLPVAEELNFKDSPYLALALKLVCPIFSGDKELKEQSKVKVLSPRELLELMGME